MESNPSFVSTVLIVRRKENSSHDLDLLKKRNDLILIMAETGAEAVKLCRIHPEISLVVISPDLPGMNGFDTTLSIRELKIELPIVLLINYSNHESIRLATMVGCNRIVQNPVNPEEMSSIVTHSLKEYRQEVTAT